LVAILTDVHHDFHGDPEGFGDLRLYVDRERVISARRHPLKTVDVLKRTLEHEGSLASTQAWLTQLTHLLAATFGELVDGIVTQADEIEDEIVAGEGPAQRGALATIRRLLVRLRRHLNANRTALHKLPTQHGREEEQSALRRALERLDGVAQDLDLVHERVRLLQDELAGLLAEATNRNLYVLSIVTTVLLPTTMITGLWGMNVGGLPWADDPHGFAWAVLIVLASVVLCLLLLRGSRVV
jgi:zinc transporter